MSFVAQLRLPDPVMGESPLFVSAVSQHPAAAVLGAFPSNALLEPAAADRRDAHQATVRRAVAYIDGHADQPVPLADIAAAAGTTGLRRTVAFIDENAHTDISVADIAAAAFVSVRAAQLAFARHMRTTPTDYLRRVRLDHAHHDLAAADPGRDTMTAIAYRWGFGSASRFTAHYRQAYSVTATQTLRDHQSPVALAAVARQTRHRTPMPQAPSTTQALRASCCYQ